MGHSGSSCSRSLCSYLEGVRPAGGERDHGTVGCSKMQRLTCMPACMLARSGCRGLGVEVSIFSVPVGVCHRWFVVCVCVSAVYQ